jgi:hypothetical protein
MNHDSLQLLKYASLLVVLIVGWFALSSVGQVFWVQLMLGSIGFGALAFYWSWLLRNKVRRRE